MKTIQVLANKIGWFYTIVTTGCFSGYSPIAPGTAGTLAAIPVYLLFFYTGYGWWVYALDVIVLFILGVQGANRIEAATEQKDCGIIVIDEVVGYLITMFLLPPHWLSVILGFFLFRLFDIVKPYPARKFDEDPKLKGFGVMIDDVFAGIYSNLVLQVVARLLWQN
jgi:phosphatidylglycerophosphatase A